MKKGVEFNLRGLYVLELSITDIEIVDNLSIEMIDRLLVVRISNEEWSYNVAYPTFSIIVNVDSCNVLFTQVKNIKISSFNLNFINCNPFCVNFSHINVGTMRINLTASLIRMYNTFIARLDGKSLKYDRLNFTGKIHEIDGDINLNNISIDKITNSCVTSYICKYII